LFHAYLKVAPSAGAAVSQAVVTANLHGAEAGLKTVDKLEQQVGTGFQPLWAARAELLSRSGQMEKASECYDKAISLATHVPVIRFLKNKQAKLIL